MAAAATTAATVKATVHSPASPFAELLRRSRFATFDPSIKQTYYAPPSYVSRGNWGLKRPIALRRKNAFITLESFEDHAQFIEWNNAESQVRMVRRIEEMNARTRTSGTPWGKQTGTSPVLYDSDYCPASEEKLAETSDTQISDRSELGTAGPRAYGSNRGPAKQDEKKKSPTHVQPNIFAMSPKEFQRYLRKLRRLRPEFHEHLKTKAKEHNEALEHMSLYQAAQVEGNFHRSFLSDVSGKEFQDKSTHKIVQQPHYSGGLMYAAPSPLETQLWTKSKPGIILQLNEADKSSKFSSPTTQYIASFGGLAAELDAPLPGDQKPLFDPSSQQGVNLADIPEAIAPMRLSRKGVKLYMPPKVVGRKARGLEGTKIEAQVVIDRPELEKEHPKSSFANPPKTGVMEYLLNQSKQPVTKALKDTQGKRHKSKNALLNSLQDMIKPKGTKEGTGERKGAGPEGL
ncbi:hypothetical protein BDQ12DRAFT_686757 [Crucibulum laeve]|uniref:Mitochondrial ribosomal protein subunit-domain-containing protein n=1 Tax=Crucibulum laeve TaxID=68775 RepID=A0A5C3LT13_9AGAR|nr:hypothetical protein BDQ12DRAFT_686757 [Crucibulum laeve]